MANTYNICTKLQSIADALGDAQTSDLIDALADIAQAISQGGGGGTSDYTQLTNKPQINGYVLSGNQTGTQLGLQSALTFDNTPTSGSTNPVTSDGVYDAIDTLNSNITVMDISSSVSFGTTGITNAQKVVYKQGKQVTVIGKAYVTIQNNLTLLSDLPAPAQEIVFALSTGPSASFFTLDTSGVLKLTSAGASGNQNTPINFTYYCA